jgi:hypothetical protein
VDPDLYRPTADAPLYDLGYLGTYSPDRQPAVERLLIEPARRLPDRRFIVGGPGFPDDIDWPATSSESATSPGRPPRLLSPPALHLNCTRADMVAAGWSPSVRLFEAAACGVPVISDPGPACPTSSNPALRDPRRPTGRRPRAPAAPLRPGRGPRGQAARWPRRHTGAARAAELAALRDLRRAAARP